MATNADLKNATSFPARADNLAYPGGKTVGNGALGRLQDTIKLRVKYPGGGAWPAGRPDANDAAAWLYAIAAAFVKDSERNVAEAAVNAPAEFEG